MPTGNKNKTNQGNTKNSGNKNQKAGIGLTNATPTVKARDRAKDMDNKRRGDTETFNI
jgi:hypothetical protein